MMPVLDCGEMWGHRIAVILRLFNFEEFAILIPVINEIFFFFLNSGNCIDEGMCEHYNCPEFCFYFCVCFRGKGDYFRLGHGTDVHVRKPQVVEGLRGKKIVHVAVGALHCLAVTDTGQVCYLSPSFPLFSPSIKKQTIEEDCNSISVD